MQQKSVSAELLKGLVVMSVHVALKCVISSVNRARMVGCRAGRRLVDKDSTPIVKSEALEVKDTDS